MPVMDLEIEILDRLYSSNDNFMARTAQEIKRAQRYLDFVSYLEVDASHINGNGNTEPYRVQEFHKKLRRYIRNSIRQTDIISGIANGRACVLLIGTPEDGVKVVGQRLQENIKYFLHEVMNSPKHWRVEILSGSFPGSESTPNTFIEKIRSILS